MAEAKPKPKFEIGTLGQALGYLSIVPLVAITFLLEEGVERFFGVERTGIGFLFAVGGLSVLGYHRLRGKSLEDNARLWYMSMAIAGGVFIAIKFLKHFYPSGG